MLIDSRDEFHNLRYASTTEQFNIKLTGQDKGTVVDGIATSLNNGSYSAELLLTVAEPYNLEIQLGVAHIDESPLMNKILV